MKLSISQLGSNAITESVCEEALQVNLRRQSTFIFQLTFDNTNSIYYSIDYNSLDACDTFSTKDIIFQLLLCSMNKVSLSI